jgi:hypothetical protein
VGLDVFVPNGLIVMGKAAPAVWGGVVPLSLQSPSISTSTEFVTLRAVSCGTQQADVLAGKPSVSVATYNICISVVQSDMF